MMTPQKIKRNYYLRNKEKCIARASLWNKTNIERRKEIVKKSNATNKAYERKRVWRETNYYDNNQTIKGKKCSVCGSDYRLAIHHADGNNGKRGMPLNNSAENLVVLCVRCHSSVHGWWGLKDVNERILSI